MTDAKPQPKRDPRFITKIEWRRLLDEIASERQTIGPGMTRLIAGDYKEKDDDE
jgi:hypothetical protein